MKNQTAEEILDQFPCIEHDGMESISYQNANISMHQFASQQSALAVAKRDEEIREWVEKNTRSKFPFVGLIDKYEFMKSLFSSKPVEPKEDEVLTSLSELIRSLSKHNECLDWIDLKRLDNAIKVLSKTIINENEIEL